MPEVGNMPLPPKLLRRGITDLVRISDARMSGTAYGTVVLHVSPEAAAGGPLALVREGDFIELDVPGRRLHLDVSGGRTGAPPRCVAAASRAGARLGEAVCGSRAAGASGRRPGFPRGWQRRRRQARFALAPCRRFVNSAGSRMAAVWKPSRWAHRNGLQAEVLTYGAILRRLSYPGGWPATGTDPATARH